MTHIVITGGAAGIGMSLAHRLAARGERVSVLDRAESDAHQWWAELPQSSRGEWHVVDVADTAAMTKAIESSHRYAAIDGLATCAGVVDQSTVLDVGVDTFTRTMEINVGGTLMAARAVARLLVAEGRPGSMVTLASSAGLGYVAGLGAAYHASKAAVVGITRSLAGDLARHGIRVNCVAPGLVRTPMTRRQRESIGEELLAARAPAGRLAEPEEVAAVADWLLSPAASFTTGHILPVDGGQTSVSVPPIGGHLVSSIDTRTSGAL
ncbi:SDR family NAD(P)-dependent oxidoreductase [Salinibacterium sp. NK8237]|uniref:SDR family NAD(P)-dependent oxidoreductase n=1 Tax=Salinibacterium sp. NK8237 TaxID=2792038 RepID=UPI0018CEE6A7|nr:SDR family oxidoreductase [Salinibacterium sp. NK8237]MBH0130645.1 SDR family oxidoreductase [Salinibacterium sp. NK8237]